MTCTPFNSYQFSAENNTVKLHNFELADSIARELQKFQSGSTRTDNEAYLESALHIVILTTLTCIVIFQERYEYLTTNFFIPATQYTLLLRRISASNAQAGAATCQG